MPNLPSSQVEGFVPIAMRVSLYRPLNPSTKRTSGISSSPSLIVLCSWMGATSKNIAKYTKGYQKLYPDAAILLVQSSVADVWALDNNTKQNARFKAACEVIISFKSAGDTTGPILLQSMSNGGSVAATRMALIFKEQGHSSVFDKFVFDCVPSKPRVEGGVRAFSMNLPKNIVVRFIGSWLIRIYMHVALFIFCTVLRREDVLTTMRKRLNDPQLFDSRAKKLYMYSKTDELVSYKDVHEHAEEAREAGWEDVREVVFETAPHCGLLIESSERYWSSVDALVRGDS